MSDFGSSDRGTVAGKLAFFLVFDVGERINRRPKIVFNFATPTNSMIVGDRIYPLK